MNRWMHMALALALLAGCGGEEERAEGAETAASETAQAEDGEETAQQAEEAAQADDGEEEAAADEGNAEEETALSATVGEAAPAFALPDQGGTEHSLQQYRGKIVVLEWINPDCPYVQRHYRANTMRGLVEAFADEDVVWLAIDSSHFVTPESSQAWREEHDLPYPILQDPSGEVGRRYGASTTPNMYVIDAQGVLRYQGAIDDDPRGREESPRNYVREAVQALVDGGAPPVAQTRPYGCTVKYENS
ncbi:MAG TPA: thioredoxin family protein [Polyangiaceae bacterium LLY-WYZ-15_(1-7)]|nr:thioredoxin family protein [Polyangiaceae bacterium LLY-WYZ-15_(1-7)]HJL06392.1 thioredoxin family protein [Polyangiaceae bacterium LLY-WYZ-15_(1-7)]HJL11321.1 thioredoxin family protein [Polyangiaceae bacterium LLY-WYZ-15_(1-7)]HJL27382.1 thioredoxin family protein [Polyangiaceae bacterium LLY-WYZ-15_(1-7)]HJL29315.1 thioredoxin family protein [Polyangiaceae bacterium LLY-WYZ-15_(1-7)]